jgi:hypothetical protein
MALRFETGARVAKSGVRAARTSLSQAVEHGHARVRDVVDASERRADDSLDVVEKAAIGVVDAIAQRGRRYAKTGKNRLYAAESRLLPRHSRSPIGTAVVAVGAGVLLSLLLRTNRVAKPGRNGVEGKATNQDSR